MRGVRGKNVLVTGGSSGIGQAIAVRFAEYGANVAINYLGRPDEARETHEQVQACVAKVRQEGVRDVLVGADVSLEDEVVRMVGETVDALGGVDVLVNNAGIQISHPSDELSSDDFDKVLAINLRGSFLCAREVIRHLLSEKKEGSIVNISSVHQLIPKPDYLGYSVSKGGMQNLTRTLALEYADRNIREFAEGYQALYRRRGFKSVVGVSRSPRTSFNSGRAPTIGAGLQREPFARIVGDVRLGASAEVGRRASIRADEGAPIVIGDNADIDDRVTFHALRGESLTIGSGLTTGDNVVFHGPLQVGNGLTIADDAVLFRAVVGDNVTIGEGALVVGPADDPIDIPSGKTIPPGAIVTTQAQLDALP